MDRQAKRELIIKNALEALQNVLPTKILTNFDQFDEEAENSDETSDDLDEDRFFFKHLIAEQANQPSKIPKTEPIDHNDSLTYFEIVEQEMMESLPVTKHNIEVISTFLLSFVFFHISKKLIGSIFFTLFSLY